MGYRTDEVHVFDKLLKDHYPKTKEIFAHAALHKPGSVKELKLEKAYGVKLSPDVVQVLRALGSLATVKVCFIMKYDDQHFRLTPFGIAVVSIKERTIKPEVDLHVE